jgi:hypothetical protein
LAHASIEFEQPVVRHPLGRASAAAFVDIAKAWSPRGSAPAVPNVDIGIGLRVDTGLIPGRLRLDVAHGIPDGRTALSAGIVSAWGR